MRIWISFFCVWLFLSGTPCDGELQPWASAGGVSWWQTHSDPVEWPTLTSALLEDLRTEFRKSVPTCMKPFNMTPQFDAWLLHLRWLLLYPLSGHNAGDKTFAEEFAKLAAEPELPRLFLDELLPQDKIPAAMKILTDIQKSDPEGLRRYPAMAAAFALVFDQEFPPFWPHHQVSRSQLPKGDLDPVQRFRFYVESAALGKLEANPAEMSVAECKLFVDSIVSLDELRWAQDNLRLSRLRLDEAFSKIKYDDDRINMRQYDWTGGSYTMENILRQGGICVDQAYYGYMGGKALGVPTLWFFGQGSDGGHAWFGYLKKQAVWELDVGRYESKNYPVGNAIDPQSWTLITDAHLKFLTGDIQRHPDRITALQLSVFANLNADNDLFHRVLAEARRLLPGLLQTWLAEAAWLEQNKAPFQQRKKFWLSWIAQFNDNRDMKVYGQENLLKILEQEKDPEAEKLRKDIVKENRRKRFDLGIGAGTEAIFAKIETKDWDGAHKEFKSIVRKFDDKGGGNLFYQLIEPYVITCLEEKQKKLAEKALEYAQRRIDVEKGTILYDEFNKLRQHVMLAQ